MKWSNRLTLLCLLLLLACIISGCSEGIKPSTKTIAMMSEEKVDTAIFPKDKIVDVKITINEEDFQSMLENATEEQYAEASVIYNGYQLDNIAMRAKGNSSLSSVARSDSNRYSFKLSFDEYVTQSIGGITKINLNNAFSDNSYMRDFLGYEIAESMGLAVPKYSFVNLYVNDELYGLYTAVEQLGPAFLEREFGTTAGTLYKSDGGTGADLALLSDDQEYTGIVEKHGQRDEQSIRNMVETLNGDDSSKYSQVLDVEAALKFIAFNTVTANMDSYLGNFKHNYYMYEQDGIFTMIPWDLNMSFGGFGGEGILIDEPTSGALADRPLVAKLLADETYLARYHEIIAEMIETSFSEGKFEQRVREIQELISEAVSNDPTSFVTFEQFEQGVEKLISFANSNIESIQKQLNGEIAST